MPATTKYTDEIADKICEKIATTDFSLDRICSADDLPDRSTIFRWLSTNEEFRRRYTIAKEFQADLLADQILEIIDDTTGDMVETAKGPKQFPVNVWRAKLRMEGRKWVAGKLKPKKYSNKPQPDTTPEIKKRQIFKIGDQEIEF